MVPQGRMEPGTAHTPKANGTTKDRGMRHGRYHNINDTANRMIDYLDEQEPVPDPKNWLKRNIVA